MKIQRLVVGPLETNCYIVGCEETKEAVVIDPGDEGRRIMKEIKDKAWKVKYIVNTHGHLDHIGANKEVIEATFAKLMIHAKDAKMLRDPALNLSQTWGEDTVSPEADRLLSDGSEFKVGTLQFEVIHTPGHSPGGICLLCDEVLFSGDTLFCQGIGRTDLPGGNYDQLMLSIKTKLLNLPEHLRIYPGHGPSTTLEEEKQHNPFLLV